MMRPNDPKFYDMLNNLTDQLIDNLSEEEMDKLYEELKKEVVKIFGKTHEESLKKIFASMEKFSEELTSFIDEINNEKEKEEKSQKPRSENKKFSDVMREFNFDRMECACEKCSEKEKTPVSKAQKTGKNGMKFTVAYIS